jgi:flagellin FlaB
MILMISIIKRRRKHNMKALIKNEEAQAGVGTLIIFIAMVLVAAVAAAVLIQTQGQMNAKASSTTKSASTAIGENLNIVAVDGQNSGGVLSSLNITLQVAPGGSSVDLSKVLLKVQGQPYNYSATASGTGTTPSSVPNAFSVYALRLSSNTSQALTTLGTNTWSLVLSPQLGPGDLARLDLTTTSLALTQNTPITLSITPANGAPISNPVTLPAFTATNISIYP